MCSFPFVLAYFQRFISLSISMYLISCVVHKIQEFVGLYVHVLQMIYTLL